MDYRLIRFNRLKRGHLVKLSTFTSVTSLIIADNTSSSSPSNQPQPRTPPKPSARRAKASVMTSQPIHLQVPPLDESHRHVVFDALEH